MKTTGMILGVAIAMLVFAPMSMAQSPGNFTTITGSGDVNIGAGRFFVDVSTRRIGIGMTNPARDFHLRRFSGGNVDFLHQNNGAGAARFIVQSSARQWIWTAGADGKYSLFGTGGAGNALIIDVNGNVGIKDATPEEALTVAGNFKASGTGTVAILEITGGSDLSEQFQIASDGLEVIPGMVVSIDAQHPGELAVASKAYDRAVAGIVSGAGGLNTGLLMGQQGTDLASGKFPVALTGRVYAYVDAAFGAVTPGDLLTTSPTAGHAMVVTDHAQAQGAVIGKAMTPLAAGEKGLVLVLVSLH